MSLTVRDWHEFQHYKQRRPPWIKWHRKLLRNPKWFELDDAAARLFTEVLLFAAEAGGVIPDPKELAYRLRRDEQEVVKSCKSLIARGFVEDASNMLAECLQVASTNGGHENGKKPTKLQPWSLDPAPWMHEVWHLELGNGERIAMTESRRQKYRLMYVEQLKNSPDPQVAWRVILRTVKHSEHHMSTRAYQLPESLLRNQDRRDKWVQEAVDLVKKSEKRVQAADDFATYYATRKNGNGH